MFRSIELPDQIKGQMYFHSMPGRYEPLQQTLEEVDKKQISKMVSLTSEQEIEEKAPDFAQAIKAASLTINRISFPIEDFGIPADQNAFLELSKHLAKALENGEHILIHCGAGIGRTGTMATSVLLSLGIDLQTASNLTKTAGSGPETSDQEELLTWVDREIHF